LSKIGQISDNFNDSSFEKVVCHHVIEHVKNPVKLLNELIRAGLDHIQITLESYNEAVHDQITGITGSWRETVQGLKNAIATPIYTLTNKGMTRYLAPFSYFRAFLYFNKISNLCFIANFTSI